MHGEFISFHTLYHFQTPAAAYVLQNTQTCRDANCVVAPNDTINLPRPTKVAPPPAENRDVIYFCISSHKPRHHRRLRFTAFV
jgi:hypothetical protein